MLKYVTLFLALFLAFLDYKAYRRIKRSGVNGIMRHMLLVFLIAINLLPLIAPLLTLLFMDESNSQNVMKYTSIIFTLFIVFTMTRLVLYIFWLPSKGRFLKYCGLISGALIFVFIMKSIFVTRTDYTVKEVDITFDNLPSSFDGYRIAFVSDIHIGSMYNKERELENIVEKVNSTEADIILFGGDLINLHHSELDRRTLEILSRKRVSHPTVAVLGNHDTGIYLRDSSGVKNRINTVELERKIASAGWVLLKDSTLYLYRGNDSIAVTGIDYSNELLMYKHSYGVPENYDPSNVYSGVDDNTFNITISHLPQLWSILGSGGYSDLVLSGHIHAFQFKIDLLGKVFSPASCMYKEWSGFYEDGNSKLYITDGIGTVGFLARLGATPEITVINLRKE